MVYYNNIIIYINNRQIGNQFLLTVLILSFALKEVTFYCFSQRKNSGIFGLNWCIFRKYVGHFLQGKFFNFDGPRRHLGCTKKMMFIWYKQTNKQTNKHQTIVYMYMQYTGSRSTFEFPSRVNLSGLSLYCTAWQG